jgi:hypothetical protein
MDMTWRLPLLEPWGFTLKPMKKKAMDAHFGNMEAHMEL